jgi:hypothetical protein
MEKIRKFKSAICFLLLLPIVACEGNQIKQQESIIETAMPNINHVMAKKSTMPVQTIAVSNEIRIALLLDTSSSMDGLIEQAKSQLWKIVLQLSKAKKGGTPASLKIALYEYGNLNLERNDGYVRQVTPFTSDLDELSKHLFALTTNGGEEYCGDVLLKSISQLDWFENTDALQVIFIAGNEPFDQGIVSYENSCEIAVDSDIIVNTIYCGDYETGVATDWKRGADLTQGYFGTIDIFQQQVAIETPYDAEIQRLNEKLNETYLAYGSTGIACYSNMIVQDQNAMTYSISSATDRASVKSSHMYSNSSWDLVDAKKNTGLVVSSVKKEELPVEMQDMDDKEQEEYIDKKAKEREKIQKQINSLNQKRLNYIALKEKESGEDQTNLDDAIIGAIVKQAKAKNFTFDEL